MLTKDSLNERSIFGTDLFYERLRREIPEASSESPIYDELYQVISNDEKPYVLTQTDLIDDVEDILQDIYLSVFVSLPEFLNNPDFFTVTEEEWAEYYNKLIESGEFREIDRNYKLVPPEIRRQGWLARITRNRISDFRRKRKKGKGINPNDQDDSTESVEQLKEIESKEWDSDYQRDIDEEYEGLVDNGGDGIDGMIGKDPKLLQEAMDRSAEREYEKKVPSALLVKRLKNACSIKQDPDRIMGFVYSNMIIPLEMDKLNNNTRSGKPTIASNKLKGKSLGEVFDQMRRDLDKVLEKDLPDSIYSQLEKRLNNVEQGIRESDKVFDLTAANISDASHRANEKIDKLIESEKKRR